MTKNTKRILLAVVAVLFLLALLGFGWFNSLSYDLPAMHESAEADALARAMMTSVNHEAWLETGAVTWMFRDQHIHIWDRQRQLAAVVWPDEGLNEVFIDLDSRGGIVLSTEEGATVPTRVEGEEKAKRLQQAWEYWANDSFWLNPIAKLFDDGTTRGLVTPQDGEFDEALRGLLITYSSGGVTPGDSYLWLVDSNSRPVAWRMWTQILPIQGLETSWEGWQELSTGAFVATKHQTPLGALGLSQIQGARTLTELELPSRSDEGWLEPFDELAARRREGVAPSRAESEAEPASSP